MAKKRMTNLEKTNYTEAEKETLANYKERLRRPPIKLKRVKDKAGNPVLETHIANKEIAEANLMETFGTPDEGLRRFLLNQVIETFRDLLTSEGNDYDKLEEVANNAAALLNGIQPRDEVEGMLAVQMIAVNNLAMEMMKLAMITGQPQEFVEASANRATKMMRTFTAQMEALKRYRTGGQQKMIVEHVNISEGGQAIVGNVVAGGGGNR
jgi:hypothetical protein